VTDTGRYHAAAGAVPDDAWAYATIRPARLFPLVRQVSCRVTPLLLRLPLTPNHVTLLAVGAGLGAAWCLRVHDPAWSAVGCLLFIACQVLDNCDGEIARRKGLRSRLGGHLDDLGDWLVHSALFVALGANVSATDGRALWLWLGIVAAVGVSVEYVFGLLRRAEEPEEPPGATPPDPAATVSPFDAAGDAGWMERAVYVLRVLIDADFCFMLPLFVVSGSLWMLLPAAAVGNQVYWAAAFYENARKFHA
jgi:phosphatidylglycerophosphate synthase